MVRTMFKALFACVFATSALALADQSAMPTPTDADRAAVEQGQGMWRAIKMLQDPRVCGIVLLRARCVSDLNALAAASGSGNATGDPSMQPMLDFAQTGNIDAYNSKWSDANSIVVADRAWSADPHTAWLQSAGIVLESSYDPIGDTMLFELMQEPNYDNLANHAFAVKPYGKLIPHDLAIATPQPPTGQAAGIKARAAALDAAQLDQLRGVLLPELRQLFPSQAEPPNVISHTLKGDMQLGVYVATADGMFHSPAVFLAPSSRVFLASLSSQLADVQMSQDNVILARALSQRFLVADNPADWKSAYDDFEKIAVGTIDSLKGQREDAFSTGYAAAHLAYNAAMQTDSNVTKNDLHALASETSADADCPGIAEKRSALAGVDPTDWHAVNSSATALTLTIMQ